jgi:hypothetical protein
MHIRLLFAIALLTVASAGESRAACNVDIPDRATQLVRFFVASGTCPFFRKPMTLNDLWALMEGSKSAPGILDAIGAGRDEANKCMGVIMPFIEQRVSSMGGTMQKGKFPDWTARMTGNSTSFCAGVKKEIDSNAAWTTVFKNMGVF